MPSSAQLADLSPFGSLELGLDPNYRFRSGTLLHFAAHANVVRGKRTQYADCLVVEVLLEKGADPNVKDSSDRTPLAVFLR